jgi:diguanylate cyclase (GGDEF)-like protein
MAASSKWSQHRRTARCSCCRSVPASAGLIGSVRKTRPLLTVTAPKLSQLSYYERHRALGGHRDGVRCASAMVLPLFEEGAQCGVLCVDRFIRQGEADNVFVTETRKRCGRRCRSFCAASSPSVSSVPSSKAGMPVVVSPPHPVCCPPHCARRGRADRAPRCFSIVSVRLCGAHRIRRQASANTSVLSVSGDPRCACKVKDLRFADNEGLCSSVIRRQTILPVGGILRDHGADTQVFDDATRLRGYRWLMVVPLLLHNKPRGTLIVAGRSEKAVPERQALLKVLANQIAVSLDNARMYQAVESLATTDGLTGLYNRRTFQQRIDEMRERAHRQGRTLSLIMCDIDHFKKINDTRGHLVGDEVLRQIARLLAETVRKVDVAARYGGEEFAILLEATEEEGAQLLAERIRHEAEKLQLQAKKARSRARCRWAWRRSPVTAGPPSS